MARFLKTKSVIKSIYDAVKKKTSEFADWILRFVPKSIKKPISEKLGIHKQQVEDIFKSGILTASKFDRVIQH